MGLATLFSYFISQILFSVLVMDHMSRLTELKVTGHIREPERPPVWKLFPYLIRQEVPRAILPVLVSVLIMILGWFVALGPILVFISSAMAVSRAATLTGLGVLEAGQLAHIR